MKVWIKILIGSVLGIVLGILLPQGNFTVLAALDWFEALALRLGRYALAPLLFFSLAISVYELRQDGKMWSLVGKTLLVIISSTAVLIGLGLLAINLFPPARVPILKEGVTEAITLNVPQNILEAFPENAFSALFTGGNNFLPLIVLAFFLGAGLSYEKTRTKTITNMVDSFARVSYYVSAFFSELLGILAIALSAYWAVRFRDALKLEAMREIFLFFALVTAFVVLVLLPATLYLFGARTNPWKQLYGASGPLLAAFFSGNYHYCMPILFRHAKENHGVRRRANTVTVTMFSLFGRGGSAMISVMALFVILRSYSSLALEANHIMGIFLVSFGTSFALARHPGTGAYVSLALLCAWYGHDFEAGYLILKPIAFYLASLGAIIDIAIASLGTWAIAKLEDHQEEREIIHFI